MTLPFDIMPLRPFTQADVWPLLTGYETHEIYQVEKTETDSLTRFDFRLLQLEQPLHDDFYGDFTAEEIQNWNNLLPQGYSFGVYPGRGAGRAGGWWSLAGRATRPGVGVPRPGRIPPHGHWPRADGARCWIAPVRIIWGW